jgi:hypothetical protein
MADNVGGLLVRKCFGTLIVFNGSAPVPAAKTFNRDLLLS